MGPIRRGQPTHGGSTCSSMTSCFSCWRRSARAASASGSACGDGLGGDRGRGGGLVLVGGTAAAGGAPPPPRVGVNSASRRCFIFWNSAHTARCLGSLGGWSPNNCCDGDPGWAGGVECGRRAGWFILVTPSTFFVCSHMASHVIAIQGRQRGEEYPFAQQVFHGAQGCVLRRSGRLLAFVALVTAKRNFRSRVAFRPGVAVATMCGLEWVSSNGRVSCKPPHEGHIFLKLGHYIAGLLGGPCFRVLPYPTISVAASGLGPDRRHRMDLMRVEDPGPPKEDAPPYFDAAAAASAPPAPAEGTARVRPSRAFPSLREQRLTAEGEALYSLVAADDGGGGGPNDAVTVHMLEEEVAAKMKGLTLGFCDEDRRQWRREIEREEERRGLQRRKVPYAPPPSCFCFRNGMSRLCSCVTCTARVLPGIVTFLASRPGWLLTSP